MDRAQGRLRRLVRLFALVPLLYQQQKQQHYAPAPCLQQVAATQLSLMPARGLTVLVLVVHRSALAVLVGGLPAADRQL